MKDDLEKTIGGEPSFDDWENSIINIIEAVDDLVDIDICKVRNSIINTLNSYFNPYSNSQSTWCALWKLLYSTYMETQTEPINMPFSDFLDFLFINDFRSEDNNAFHILRGRCPGNISKNNLSPVTVSEHRTLRMWRM